ncbi:putative methyltransferase NSUN6 isoform X2 [Asparagus officinalis]|uniref:putative methyltransferase NSUN6 isoform X2 n=1 Tax=Asparagus officinalis TaxID=4686 RepID=UPI00098DE961|nr:putative methyltransferase NSUN6 isoform X2 [Asparagus officinalis]
MKKGREFLLQISRRRHSTSSQTMDSSSSSSPSDRYSFNPKLQWNPEVEEYLVKAYGAEHFARISKSLTHPSSYSCIRVNTLKSISDNVITKLMKILDEKKFSSRTSRMDIREHGAIDEVDQGNFDKTPELGTTTRFGDMNNSTRELQIPSIYKCEYPGLDNVVFVKGSGPHELHYGDQAAQPLKEIIVSRKCAEAVLRGAQVFVPGVLACSSHVEKGDVVAVSVAVEQPGPDGKWGFGITRGIVLQGIQSDPQYHERSGLYIGQGTAVMSRAGIFRASKGVAVEMINRIYELPSFYDVLQGEIFLQNLPSIVATRVLDPQEGERILDMCAAPGGKTTGVAILMKDKGEVIANDRSHNKVMDIKKLAAEMDLTCINASKLDALKSVCQSKETKNVDIKDRNSDELDVAVKNSGYLGSRNGEAITCSADTYKTDGFTENASSGKTSNGRYLSKADLRKDARRMRNGPGRNCMGARVEISKGYMPNSFDRVLLDAPCSALGLRPRLFAGEETLESLHHHARYQKKMFDQAIQLVRTGGVIVYSTCTINPGENEAFVRYALDKYKFLSLAPQHPKIGGPGLIGHCELYDGKYEEWLTESEAELVQRFDPSSSVDTIGFFIAKFNVGQKDI